MKRTKIFFICLCFYICFLPVLYGQPEQSVGSKEFTGDNNNDSPVNDNSITIRDGWGKHHYSNGDYYEGNWKNGVWDHTGTLIKKNGDRYVGRFKNGKPHSCVVVRISGKLSAHYFDQGKIDWTRQSELDTWYKENGPKPHEGTEPLLLQYALASPMFDKGCLFGDCENGTGISYFGDYECNVYYGPHKNGKPDGVGEMFTRFYNQITYKGPFKEGKLHGMIRRESRKEIFLDRIFYEGKLETGFYNSMEQFESILAKEMEEIERESANRPKSSIEWYYPDKDNNNNKASTSSEIQKEKPLRLSNGGFYTCKFLVAGTEYSESYYAVVDVWATVYTDNIAELSSVPVQLNFESHCGTAIITYECNDDGTGGKGYYKDNCYKGGVVLISWNLKNWNY